MEGKKVVTHHFYYKEKGKISQAPQQGGDGDAGGELHGKGVVQVAILDCSQHPPEGEEELGRWHRHLTDPKEEEWEDFLEEAFERWWSWRKAPRRGKRKKREEETSSPTLTQILQGFRELEKARRVYRVYRLKKALGNLLEVAGEALLPDEERVVKELYTLFEGVYASFQNEIPMKGGIG